VVVLWFQDVTTTITRQAENDSLRHYLQQPMELISSRFYSLYVSAPTYNPDGKKIHSPPTDILPLGEFNNSTTTELNDTAKVLHVQLLTSQPEGAAYLWLL
jgi:hypothetical protein